MSSNGEVSSPVLRETDIRPDHLMKEQVARFEADVQRLLRHRAEFVTVPCPACSSSSHEHAWRKYELDYVRCRECDTVYLSPRPTPSLLEAYYSNSENYDYWNKHIFPASEVARRENIFKPRAARLADICRRHGLAGTLLEVGAGFGTFSEEVRKLNLFERVISVEPTPQLANTCRGRGLEVIEAPIEQVQLSEQVDVVASFEVIEHLFSPRKFVESCAQMLSAGGLLVLTCPNVRGFDIVVMGQVSVAVDVEHLNYFHPRSLSALLESCGFDTLEVFTPGKLDAELVRKRVLNGEFGLKGQPFLQQVLIDDWERVGDAFQEFLAAAGLSSHMWLVARKR